MKFLKRHKILLCIVLLICLLCSCINVYAAEDYESVIVTESDGKSYGNLPDFPTRRYFTYTGDSVYETFSDYILIYDDTDGTYYLHCLPTPNSGEDYEFYVSTYDTGYSLSGHTYYSNYYNVSDDSRHTKMLYGVASGDKVYTCTDSSLSWSYLSNGNSLRGTSAFNFESILTSSLTLYSDDTYTSVFTNRVQELSVGSLNPTKMSSLMMTETVGLIALVIGLLTLALGFWKGLRVLRQALANS